MPMTRGRFVRLAEPDATTRSDALLPFAEAGVAGMRDAAMLHR